MKPDYPSTQSELYSVSETIFASVTFYLSKFADLKPGKYVVGFVPGLETIRTTAMKLPDDDQRRAAHELQRVKLVKLGAVCIDDFGKLVTYINDGWPEEEHKAVCIEAGMNELKQAEKDNWEKLAAMNTKMNAFIANVDNAAKLTTGFMPVGFAAQVTSDTGAFASKYVDFKSARETGPATSAKITANNGLYKHVEDVYEDAKVVFKDDEDILKLFNFAHVKLIVSPPGSASLEVELIKAVTNEKVDGKIIIQSATGVAISKDTVDGVAKFVSVDPDDYIVKVIVVGSPEVTVKKEVNTGVNARLKITIE